MLRTCYDVKPTQAIENLFNHLSLILDHKDEIYQSYLLYQIETECSFGLGTQRQYFLRLGEWLSLLEPFGKKTTSWRFLAKNMEEIFTYKIRGLQKEGQYLGFGVGAKGEPCVYMIYDFMPDETLFTTQILLSDGMEQFIKQNIPSELAHLPSIYSLDDLVKSLEEHRPIKEIFEERIATKPYTLDHCKGKSYLYPNDDVPYGFCAKTFN